MTKYLELSAAHKIEIGISINSDVFWGGMNIKLSTKKAGPNIFL